MIENEAKEKVIERLYQRAGICMLCFEPKCPHKGSQTLPKMLKQKDVLWAINLDNYFD